MAYTLRQLDYAVAVTDSGSIAEAARRLGVSQPAISAALKHLEHEFGFSIFVRRPAHRIALTPAGQRFILTTRGLLEETRVFENRARGLGRDIEGIIDVGCFLPTAPFIMPLLLRPLRVKYAGITMAEIRRSLAASLGYCAILAVLSVIFAEIVIQSGLARPLEAIIAFAPGGQAEMVLLAIVAGSDMPYVVTHHLVRILVVILGAPVVARLVARKRS